MAGNGASLCAAERSGANLCCLPTVGTSIIYSAALPLCEKAKQTIIKRCIRFPHKWCTLNGSLTI